MYMSMPIDLIPFLFQSRRDVPKPAQAGTDRRLVVDVSGANVAQPWVAKVMIAQPQRGGPKKVKAAPLGLLACVERLPRVAQMLASLHLLHPGLT